MNNEQMVSVPRELLERCDFGKNTAVAMAALTELRALLTQPAAQHQSAPIERDERAAICTECGCCGDHYPGCMSLEARSALERKP